jgi:hypothetical protein
MLLVNLDLIVEAAEEMQRVFHPFCSVPAGAGDRGLGCEVI